MKLLFNRKMRTTFMRAFLCVLIVGLMSSAIYAQTQELLNRRADLPVLGFGVRDNAADGGAAFKSDITFTDWWPDNRIWTVPSKIGSNNEPIWNEVLVPVFILNRWYNFNVINIGGRLSPIPGVKFQEISSFAFKVYYDDRNLQFVDIQKHHPYTEEEARNLYATHYYSYSDEADIGMEYYTPLGYNFNITAATEKATDFYRYFDKYDTMTVKTKNGLNDSIVYRHDTIGSIITVSGTASSFHNLDTTPYKGSRNGEDNGRVLLYLRFRVKQVAGQVASYNKIYFDPTYIYYNGVNIAKDRAVKLLEDFPLPDDPNRVYLLTGGPAGQSAFAKTFDNYEQTNNNMQYFDDSWSEDEKTEQVIRRSVGLQKYGNYAGHPTGSAEKYSADPYLPGSITVAIQTNYSGFNFSVNDPMSFQRDDQRIIQNSEDKSLWILAEPITADTLRRARTSPPYQNRSERVIEVSNTLSSPTTIEDIVIETDQAWLKVRSQPAAYDEVFSSNLFEDKFSRGMLPVRRAFCQRINNLMPVYGNAMNNDYNPFAADITGQNQPRRFRIFIDCDQKGLAPGEYVGHVSLRSPFDLYKSTRIQVRFIVLDVPRERAVTPNQNPEEAVPFGIILKVHPFNMTRPDLTKTLIMGSAPLATDLNDSLYGEYVRTHPLGYNRFGNNTIPAYDFDARFFLDTFAFSPDARPTDPVELNNWRNLATYGFGDYTHHDGLSNAIIANPSPGYVGYLDRNDNKQPRSHSRDIRSSVPGIHSHIHMVRFQYKQSGTIDYHPVVLEWDTAHFPAANTVHLRYKMNGIDQIRDMRTEGTHIGSGKFTFTFDDRNVDTFWIEYTIGQESRDDLVDNFGDQMIMPYAWNFVSLPLDPINKYYNYIFPNSLNIPYWFNQNQWQQPANGMLTPGMGYFVKYNATVDKTFNGAYFNLIARANYPIKLYSGTPGRGGWNAIGGISRVVSTNNIKFDAFDTGEIADTNYTRHHGVWAYRPNKGYAEVNSLYPGKGYFIKVDANAHLRIDGRVAKSIADMPVALPNRVAGFDKITVADGSQNMANIYAANNIDINNYQLPPLPPTEMFDVRFSKDNYATNYEASTVNMQGITYPVVVNFDNPRANYSVIDPVSGAIYGTAKAGEVSNVIISSSKSNSFKLVAEASNETFFVYVNQNPVTTNSAEVTFGIDNDANTSLSIFNSIGVEVANVDATLNKGIHYKTFDVTNLPSGVYTVRLIANGEARIFMMNIIK